MAVGRMHLSLLVTARLGSGEVAYSPGGYAYHQILVNYDFGTSRYS